jgi:hypothetical protein
MKSEQRNSRLSVVMMAAATTFLTACVMEVDGDENAGSEQSELMAGEATPDESLATEEPASVNEAELAAGVRASAEGRDDDVVTAAVPCRRVTAVSIAVYDGPLSSVVQCRFFQGDVFSYFGRVWPSARYVTWCPRGVPPSQGTTGFASPNGHVNGGCG